VEGLSRRRVNSTENRPALHTALRGGEHVVVDGTDLRPQLQRAHERMRVFAEAVRDGLWKGVGGGRSRMCWPSASAARRSATAS